MTMICLCLSTPAFAQYRTSIQGVVTDQQGAVVPGATLTLTDLSTNLTVIRTSNEAGVFNFNALPADRFSLVVEQKGFKKKMLSDLQLIPEQPNGVNVELEIGATSETVSVNASAVPAIDTETASITGTISANQIEHMPSFGRDALSLLQLTPGLFGDGAQGNAGNGQNLPGTQTGGGAPNGGAGIFQTENGPQVLANGGQFENNGISIDGISVTSAVWGGNTVITPTEDSIENIKVVSNGYDAENGRFSGAQVQITSKSGTNQIHGSLFWDAHRPGLNAFQRYGGTGNPQKDTHQFNQFGGSVGGPIWKNKIFGFFAYETIRASFNGTANGWYDTAAFDALGAPGSIANKILTYPGSGVSAAKMGPSTCLTAGLTEGVNCATIGTSGINIGTPLTSALGTQDPTWTNDPQHAGLGSGLGTVADIAQYTTSTPTTNTDVQYNGRLDANLTNKDRLGFAIYWVPVTSTFYNGTARPYNNFHHQAINDAFSLIWNHVFSPTFLNEARANAAGWRWNEIASNPQQPVGLPEVNIGSLGSITPSSFGASVGSHDDQWTFSYKDVATKVIGRHTVKFGGEVTRLYYLNNCVGCGVPNFNFFNIWDFLNDAPHTEYASFDPHTGIPTANRQDDREDIWGFFAQDDFKLKRNLTVNLGLRYSYFGPLSAKAGNMFVAVLGSGAAEMTGLNIRKGGNLWNAQKGNFGPQVGFAWSPMQFHDKLVVRGGYGLNYNQEEIAISANVQGNPGLTQFNYLNMNLPSSPNPGIVYAIPGNARSLVYPANPNTIASFGTNGLPTTGSVNISAFPSNLPTMLTHHYSLDTQYDLGHHYVATLGYQGSLSRNTYFHANPNAVPATKGYTLNPAVSGGDYWGVNGSGNYNSMLAGLKHEFAHNFTADAEFSWAKSMDTSSAPYSEQDYPYNPNLSYGRSDYNVGKAFKLFGMWQPVIFRGEHGWLEKVAGGWSLSGILNIHSGFPWNPVVNVVGGNLYCGSCGYGQLLPTEYFGGAGSSTSNDQFKTGSNYPLAHVTGANGTAYYNTPASAYTAYSGSAYGTALPTAPLVHRNSLTGPGYRDLDLSLAKSFGFPNVPGLGERAKLEFRADAFNLFNLLNFNPTSISNNVSNSNFGVAQSALGGRTVSLQARFSF